MDSIHFNRKPYVVTYKDLHTDEIVRVKRRPPPKIHDILPTDVVSLNYTKNEDFQEGDEFTVKHISQRQPNILQLVDDDGRTTFVPNFYANLEEENAYRGSKQIDNPRANRYLTWP